MINWLGLLTIVPLLCHPHPLLILLSLSCGRDSASVRVHTLGPQRGTLCLQTFMLSGAWQRSDKPSKLTILVSRLVYFNGFISYLHLFTWLLECICVQSVIWALQMYDMIRYDILFVWFRQFRCIFAKIKIVFITFSVLKAIQLPLYWVET